MGVLPCFHPHFGSFLCSPFDSRGLTCSRRRDAPRLICLPCLPVFSLSLHERLLFPRGGGLVRTYSVSTVTAAEISPGWFVRSHQRMADLSPSLICLPRFLSVSLSLSVRPPLSPFLCLFLSFLSHPSWVHFFSLSLTSPFFCVLFLSCPLCVSPLPAVCSLNRAVSTQNQYFCCPDSNRAGRL